MNANSSDDKIKVGITVGDVNGIGLEVIIKTLSDNRILQLCTPIVYGSSKTVAFHRKTLGISDISFLNIKDANQANSKNVNLVNCWEEEVAIELGNPSPVGGKYALKSLQAAITDIQNNKIDVLVTAPIDKNTIQTDAFNFPGHTEFLAKQFQVEENLMLLVSDTLRVGVITGHVPITKVASLLNVELIIKKIKILNKSLKEDFGIRKPKIAVLGLNPHAGDKGLIGEEEEKIIMPAITKMKEENLLVFGPYAADGFFGSGNFKNFDGILAMYHDQGLVPFKTLSFGSGVNFTAGLPIVRTSPDHGTGYDIAGKNLASEDSFRQALYQACDIFKNRLEYKALTANPLKITNLKRE